MSACVCVCKCSHLQVCDELCDGDLLSDAVVESAAVQHHALQHSQRTLQDRHIHQRLGHMTRNLNTPRPQTPMTTKTEPIVLLLINLSQL